MKKTLADQLALLNVYGMTGRDLRVAAKVASACGDLVLAQRLREIHDEERNTPARRAESEAFTREVEQVFQGH